MRELFSVFVLLFASTVFAQSKKDWVQLFDGKSLDGWHVKIRNYELDNNFGNTFRVEKGKMTVSYENYDAYNERFGHIFYKNPYSYYHIRVVYRFVGNQVPGGPEWAIRNNGIMLHCQSPESMGLNQDFPISIEVQLLGGNGKDKRTTSNLCTPGTNVVYDGKLDTRHCINSDSETYHGDQWVQADVLVYGDSLIIHQVNGEEVMRYTNPQIGGGNVDDLLEGIKVDGAPLTSGYISLQSESHPTQFKKIEILNLEGCMDPKAKNYKPYFVKADNSKCSY